MLVAAILTGIMSGVFQTYAHTVMPGLGRTDDRTFIGAFQAMDRAIINPLFLVTFLGSFLLTGAAACSASARRCGDRCPLWSSPWARPA